MDLLLRGGTCVTALDRWQGDLRCREGRIVELGTDLEKLPGETALDASGQLVFPGGVDPHVHLQLPVAGTVSVDDFESGSAAGLAGGTTTFLDFVHPQRGEDPVAALEARRAEAMSSLADYGFHMAVTWWGRGMAGRMAECVRRGVSSFKLYLAYLDTVGIEDRELVSALAAAAKLRARVLVHAEHGAVIEHLRDRLAAQGERSPTAHPRSRPTEAEGEATHRIAMLAALTGARVYVVHLTCREALEALAGARARGIEICAETCPQYLLLDDRVYHKEGFEGAAYVVSPPIRPVGHQTPLWNALANGTLQTVGTDHCPFDLVGQKELGRDDFRRIPGGAAGIEHRLTLLWTYGVGAGRFDAHRFVELTSTAPAKLFGLYPRKGAIRVGSDADLVLWDPLATGRISAATHRTRCDRSLYEGFETTGAPITVISRGEVVFREGELRGKAGRGRFLERHTLPTP